MTTTEMSYDEFVLMAKDGGFDLDVPFEAVTLAAFVVGPRIRRIAKFLGRPERWCNYAARNLRKNGAWRGGKIVMEEGGDVYFNALFQTALASGLIERVS